MVIHTIEAECKWHIVGLIDDFAEPGKLCYGHMVHGNCSAFTAIAAKHDAGAAFIAVGENDGRRRVWSAVQKSGLYWPHIIHPRACVFPGAQIEAGAFIAAGAVVGPGATVGRFAIMNTNSSLDHDASLGDFSHMAPNSATGGHARIGENTFIGIGASIRDRVRVGDNCLVGMGSCVVEDIEAGKAWGNPARAK